MKSILYKPDTFGALASTLCLIHCFATPFLFIAHTCSLSCSEAAPLWWQSIDYLFLVISLFAVYRSTQTSSNKFIKPLLWINWVALFVLIVNEKLNWFPLPEAITYVAAFTLAALHLYNLKYCQCKTDKCCTNNG